MLGSTQGNMVSFISTESYGHPYFALYSPDARRQAPDSLIARNVLRDMI
jgi:hypothetical protein